MNSLGRNNDQNQNKQTVFTKETIGVVLILFATLLLVCLITDDAIFSVPGKFVNSFLLGCFGYFSFLVTAFMMFLGILLVAEKKLPLSAKQKTFIAIIICLSAILIHIVTMRGNTLDYGAYLATSYKLGADGLSACSGGGFFCAVVAFPISSILSEVGSYVVLGVLIALCGYAVVSDMVKNYRPVGKTANQKFRSSYVKKKKTDLSTVDGLELRDYPIEDLEYPDLEEKEKPAQKLFVNNSSDFGFKSRRDLKNESNENGVKLQPSTNGFNIASQPKTYSETYGSEMQQRIEYIKTPAKIDLENTLKQSNSNYGSTYVSNPIPQTVNKPVSSYESSPVIEEPEKPVETPTAIPLYEHDESLNTENSAASHAERFSNSYAEIEDMEIPATIPVETVEDYRSLRMESPIVETPVGNIAEPIVEENIDDQPEIVIPMVEEPEPEIIEEPPVSNIVRGERSRSILFGDDKKEEQSTPTPTPFTDNIIPENGNRRRNIFGMDKVSVEPTPEPIPEPKKEKTVVPINREYFRPPFDLLEDHAQPLNAGQENHEERMEIIKRTLEEFRIGAIPQSYIQGPSFTRYEIMMPAGISVKKVLGYDDDLKMRLAAKDGVRIEAPIPGKDLVGIEVANTVKTMVGFKSVMEGLAEKGKKGSLIFAVGKDIVGNSISYDLAKGPHYLIAGATGSGKSVCLHVMIVSLLMRYSPEELKIVLIDPKSVEFRKYDHIPHLLVDEVITDTKRAITLLQWAYEETNRRNEMFTNCGGMVSNIDEYNSQIANDTVPKLPRIVFFIDELADLMEMCKKDLEEKIRKIAAKSRSAGIHLVLATQRPSVDVITGTIKANLPSRIALRVMNFADSTTILGEGGAEKLLGNGDMLYKDSSMGNYERYQGAYISNREITNVINYIKEHNKAYFDDEVKDYLEEQTNPKQDETAVDCVDAMGDPNAVDAFFLQALSLAVNSGTISISQLQRRYSIGYARAGGIVDKMERMGYCSGNEGSKARRVLLTREEFEQRYGNISD